MSAAANADIVIEAVFEDKQVKADLFKQLDAICSEATILATNTSSFYVGELARHTSRPDRFIGLHYFYHPAKNRLLEVIPHDGTSRRTLETALLAAKLHSKTAIVVKDAPGFAVNRFFVPFLNEAVRLLEEGAANIPTIEKAAKQAFKIAMGPFELMNVTGIPIAVHAATTLGDELGPFYAPAAALRDQMKTGRNWNLSGPIAADRLPAATDRLLGVCLGVAGALVDEQVASIEDTDRGAKIGLRWALGPFELMNAIGIDKTYAVVAAIAEKYPDMSVPRTIGRQRELSRPFAFKFVDMDISGDIATITLNRPEAMNALNEAVAEQLDQRFTEAEKNPAVSAIVLQGAGKAFVAGADIRFFINKIKADRIDDIVTFTRKGHELLLRIENSPKRTIALLDGLSLGGGTELALACQAIVATPGGSLAFPETGIGIYPGLGGMLRLARQVGPELAKYYVLTGAAMTAADAAELGIVAEVVPPADTAEAIRRRIDADAPDKYRMRDIPEKFKPLAALGGRANVDRLLAGEMPDGVPADIGAKALKIIGYKAPLALKMADEIIDAQMGKPIRDAVAIELQRLPEVFATADALEGMSSLGRKRPEFKGA
jgi:enoyl-CoA hydratase/3-hydroxyacyl-CoA dehydrogenase